METEDLTCVICCSSRKSDFQPEPDKSSSFRRGRIPRGGQTRSDNGNGCDNEEDNSPEDVFRAFCKDLLSFGGSLDLAGRNLSVCSDCLVNMNTVMDTNGRIKVVEDSVRKLQLRLLQDLKELQVYMDLLGLQLGKIERSVKGSSSSELESKLRKVGMRGGGGVGGKRRRNVKGSISPSPPPRDKCKDDVLLVRERIANVTNDLRLFRDGLTQKISCENFAAPGPLRGGANHDFEDTLTSTSTWDDLEGNSEGGDGDDDRDQAEVGDGDQFESEEDASSDHNEVTRVGAQEDVDIKPSLGDDDEVLDLNGEYLLPPSSPAPSAPTLPCSTGPEVDDSPTDCNQEEEPPHSAAKRPSRGSTKNKKMEPDMLSDSDVARLEDDDDEDFSCGDNDDDDDDASGSEDGNYESSSKSGKRVTSFSYREWQSLNAKANAVVLAVVDLDTTGMSVFKKSLIKRKYVVEEAPKEDFTGADNVTADSTSTEAYLKRLKSYLISTPLVYSTRSGALHLNGIEIRINDQDKTLDCSQCSYTTAVYLPSRSQTRGRREARQYIRKHIFFHHMKLLKCPLCQVTPYHTMRPYKAHLDAHAKGVSTIPESTPTSSQLSCNICNKTLPTMGHLARHVWGHKTQEEKEAAFYVDELRVTCMDCGKLIMRKNLTSHKELVCLPEGAPRIQCPHCDMTFKNRTTLGGHVERFHTNRTTNDRPFKCQHCHKQFRIKRDVTRHLLIHRKEKDFICGKGCGKAFNVRRNRNVHEANCKGAKATKSK